MAYSDIDFFGKGKTYDFWEVPVANMSGWLLLLPIWREIQRYIARNGLEHLLCSFIMSVPVPSHRVHERITMIHQCMSSSNHPIRIGAGSMSTYAQANWCRRVVDSAISPSTKPTVISSVRTSHQTSIAKRTLVELGMVSHDTTQSKCQSHATRYAAPLLTVSC
jgi:hypothetical protein